MKQLGNHAPDFLLVRTCDLFRDFNDLCYTFSLVLTVNYFLDDEADLW